MSQFALSSKRELIFDQIQRRRLPPRPLSIQPAKKKALNQIALTKDNLEMFRKENVEDRRGKVEMNPNFFDSFMKNLTVAKPISSSAAFNTVDNLYGTNNVALPTLKGVQTQRNLA